MHRVRNTAQRGRVVCVGPLGSVLRRGLFCRTNRRRVLQNCAMFQIVAKFVRQPPRPTDADAAIFRESVEILQVRLFPEARHQICQ